MKQLNTNKTTKSLEVRMSWRKPRFDLRDKKELVLFILAYTTYRSKHLTLQDVANIFTIVAAALVVLAFKVY